MKITALGGCGDMGRYAVRTAIGFDFVDEVVIADLDAGRAAAFAAECGDKARPKAVNAEDEASLDAAIAGSDVVLNTIGPFYRFGVPILRASIRNGAHYLDICDDWEPTLEMLELGPDAEAAGVTAIVGVGASPGVSNLLAVKAMEGLDRVDTLVTGWSIGSDPASGAAAEREPSAALVHWIHQCSGAIRVARNGSMTDLPPIEEVTVDYPGIGKGRAWTVGHPEAVTLPRHRQDLRNSCNVMVGSPVRIEIMRGLAARVDSGELTPYEAAKRLLAGDVSHGAVTPSPFDAVRLPPLFAHATGVRGGVPVRVGAMVLALPPTGMGGSTGVPLAVGLSQFAAGRITRPGVFAPEDVIDPDSFFDELARHCKPARTGVDEMVRVTAVPSELRARRGSLVSE